MDTQIPKVFELDIFPFRNFAPLVFIRVLYPNSSALYRKYPGQWIPNTKSKNTQSFASNIESIGETRYRIKEKSK
ncbi:hypothetical protein BEN43_08515 [Leptospira interrogans serovar Bataviae]|nr:hypothetical protein [Leptospira interrogans serovar Bataviae]